MRIWIDTEFNDFKGELISIALISEDGREFYRVLECKNPSGWVAENVIPVLNAESIKIEELQTDLMKFLSIYMQIHIIADWPEDIKHFCDLLITGPGSRIDTPPLTMEVKRDINTEASLIPHNALADVRAMRLMDLAIGER
jgi:hypothetical protein